MNLPQSSMLRACCIASLSLAACSSKDNSGGTLPIAPAASEQSFSTTNPASSNILFSDNFVSDTVGQAAKGWNALAGTWNVCQPPASTHEYCSLGQAHEMSVPSAGGTSWADYEFDADVTKPATGSYGLLARMQDASHFYAFSFDASTSKTSQPWSLRKFDGSWTDLRGGTIGVAPGNVVHARFVLAGNTLMVYASGSTDPPLLASVNDASFRSGGIGLATAATSLAHVDNIVVTSRAGGTGPGTRVSPISADQIADMVGVNTHFGYHDTPYGTTPAIRTTLLSSNLRHYRDSAAGVPNNNLGLGMDDTAARIAAMRKLSPSAQYIELCGNEEDNNSVYGSNWPRILRACVARELPLVRGYGLPIVAPSLADVRNSARLGHLDVDYANVHFGTCGDNPGTTRYPSIADAAADSAKVAPKYWVTETSYDSRRTRVMDDSLYGRACAIPDRYIAAYDVRMVFEWKRIGAARTYFYQGADMPSDTEFGGTGLVNPDGSPKPQFNALNNLVALFSDRGAPPDGRPVNVSISANANVHDIVTERSNGTLLVAIWREATDIAWETQRATNLPLAPASVAVAGYAVVALHEFQPDGALKTVFADCANLALGPDAIVVELHRN